MIYIINIYIYICVCMYVCMYVCMCPIGSWGQLQPKTMNAKGNISVSLSLSLSLYMCSVCVWLKCASLPAVKPNSWEEYRSAICMLIVVLSTLLFSSACGMASASSVCVESSKCAPVLNRQTQPWSDDWARMYVCMCVYVCVCCVCMQACMDECKHACMHACLYTSVQAWIVCPWGGGVPGLQSPPSINIP